MSQIQLMRRAVTLFPRTSYTPDSAVRHARRAHIAAVKYLRDRPVSIYILDKPVERVQ